MITHILPGVSLVNGIPDDWQIYLMIFFIVAAVVFYITEWLPVELVAIVLTLLLVLLGIITPAQGISGFGNKATVTVASMFVISAALYKTGALNLFGDILARQGKISDKRLLLFIIIISGAISPFINNTAVVAIFIPIVMGIASDLNRSPSKLLIPLSFASLFGGACTLIGTSTNILADSLSEKYGGGSIGIFDFAPLGLIFFATGGTYLYFWGADRLPARRSAEGVAETIGLGQYITRILIPEDSDLAGQPLLESKLMTRTNLEILSLERDGKTIQNFTPEFLVDQGDILTIRCSLKRLKDIIKVSGIHLMKGEGFEEIEGSTDHLLAEVMIPPGSRLEGKPVTQSVLGRNIEGSILALRDRHRQSLWPLEKSKLQAGDIVLLGTHQNTTELISKSKEIVLVSRHEFPQLQRVKAAIAIGISIIMVTLATLNILPIHVGAVTAVVVMVLFRCINMKEFYEAIDWKIIFLLAGLLPFGIAIATTGTSDLLAQLLTGSLGGFPPIVLLSLIYLITTILTEVISNTGTVVILIPIAFATALALEVNPKPFVMAIAYAASASFLTPIGYQTNTMIYTTGNYKFADYFKVGFPLSILFWLLATFLLPVFFPF
ncbi:MAG: SLC13 family permease [Bacteroidia bacterium]